MQPLVLQARYTRKHERVGELPRRKTASHDSSEGWTAKDLKALRDQSQMPEAQFSALKRTVTVQLARADILAPALAKRG